MKIVANTEKEFLETMFSRRRYIVMPWVNLSVLIAQLRQRRINPANIVVFIDDHLVDPRYRRPLPGDSTPEETEDLYDDDSEED